MGRATAAIDGCEEASIETGRPVSINLMLAPVKRRSKEKGFRAEGGEALLGLVDIGSDTLNNQAQELTPLEEFTGPHWYA